MDLVAAFFAGMVLKTRRKGRPGRWDVGHWDATAPCTSIKALKGEVPGRYGHSVCARKALQGKAAG